MKRPMTGLAIMFAAGIFAGSLGAWPLSSLYLLAAVVLGVFLLLYRRGYSLMPLLAFVFVAGMLAYRHATANLPPHHLARLLPACDQNATVRGMIVSDPGRQEEADDTDRVSFRLAVEAVQRAGAWQPATGRVYAFASQTRPADRLRYGDRIECTLLLRVPAAARNPGVFDWRRWLNRQGIYFTATIRPTDECRVLARDRGHRLVAVSLRLRERFEQALRRGLENEPKLAGVLAGMVIGARSEIPPDTYATFQHTGVFHVFAISGLHVGFVTAVVLVGLRLARLPRRWTALAGIPLLVLYVFATGARPGAIRALVIGGMLVRPTDLLNTLATAALVILVWQPTQLFDAGFQMSFGAAASLVLLLPGSALWRLAVATADENRPKLTWYEQLFNPDPFLPEQLVPAWRKSVKKAGCWLGRLVSASLAAWIGLLPLLAVYFNLFTPISVLANVWVIPLLAAIIPVGMIAMVADAAWPWLTLTLNNANYFLLGTMMRGVEWLGTVPWGHWFVRTPPGWWVAAFYAAGLLWLKTGRRWWPAVAAPLLSVAMLWPDGPRDCVDLTVLDSNQGTVVFLDLPGECHDALIDGGTLWNAESQLVPFLRSRGVDRLAAVFVTRGDKAHVEGVSAVARQIPVGRAVHSGHPTRSKFYDLWLREMKALGVPVETARAGQVVALSDTVRLRVLHPGALPLSGRGEDNTAVLVLETGPHRVLLAGDASEAALRHLLENGTDLRAPVVVKGEHTRDLDSLLALADAAQPNVVIQAVSSWPSRRYPRHEWGDRLRERGVQYYRTDEAGAVTIRLAGNQLTVQPWLR
jgi:competence protein ComEC